MALLDIRRRSGYLFLAVMIGHVILISAQVNSRSGVPVLANARSEVLRDHVRASRGGLYYDGPAEYAAALEYLLDRPELRARMGRNGRRYVAENYAWPRVDATYDRVIADLASRRAEAPLGTR